jgi:hypothetical protein
MLVDYRAIKISKFAMTWLNIVYFTVARDYVLHAGLSPGVHAKRPSA